MSFFEENNNEIACDIPYSKISKAKLIDKSKEYGNFIVADIICDKENGYNVDKLGLLDSSDELQKAIDDCYSFGGGTVYLPKGEYRITKRIVIKPFVCLIGDYNSFKNDCNDYGTVILCCVISSKEDCGEKVNVFRMAGSSAIIGLTFFYPEQSLEDIKSYGYTIEIPGRIDCSYFYMFTLKNLTFINAYKGICCAISKQGEIYPHEQLFIENVKGTFLKNAMHLSNSSEVGAFNGIQINSSYWTKAPEKYNPCKKNIIENFIHENAIALILGDLEWQQIENVEIIGYHIGIYFTKGDRKSEIPMCFIGEFINLIISNCSIGIYIVEMYIHMGIEFCDCRICGEQYSIVNCSPKEKGQVLLSNVKLVGKICGCNIYTDEKYIENYGSRKEFIYKLPELILYNVLNYNIKNNGQEDCSEKINELLFQIKDSGGILYFPSGIYRIEKEIVIYSNTQIRGTGEHITKDLTKGYLLGTTFLCYGVEKKIKNKISPLINMVGVNSSVCQIKFIYPKQNLFKEEIDKNNLLKYDYLFGIYGDNNSLTNIYISNARRGVYVKDSKNFLLKKIMGGFFGNMFSIINSNGTIDTCLCNSIAPFFVSKNRIEEVKDWNIDIHTICGPIQKLTRNNNKILCAQSSKIDIKGLFTYASNTFISAVNSNIFAENIGFDSQPRKKGYLFNLKNSKVAVKNVLRDACGVYGKFYKNINSFLTMQNRITLTLNNSINPDCDIILNVESKKKNILGEKAFIMELKEI